MSTTSANTPLLVCQGDADYRPASSEEVLSAARRVMAHRVRRGATLSSPAVTRDYLTLKFAEREHEVFVLILLDAQHRIIDVLELFRGSIDGATVYPREVVKAALAHNAAAVIFAHNHPSGLSEPSSMDRILTTRLREALTVVEIRVLDHLVIGGRDISSFAERGWL